MICDKYYRGQIENDHDFSVYLIVDTNGGKLSQRHICKALPRHARLFGIGTGHYIGWGDADLRDSLSDELKTPIFNWLRHEVIFAHPTIATDFAAEHRGLVSVGDLLSRAQPPLDVLRCAKESAKSADTRKNDPLPQPVAVALYLSMIAAALVRCGQRITEMNDREFRQGLAWLMRQSWIDESIRELAKRALGVLK